jgi:putative chitinase
MPVSRDTLREGACEYFKSHPDEADTYGKSDGQKADGEGIANRAYAGRNGNGDIASGDGYKYRGGGLIQLTGKGNFEDVQKEIDAKDPGSGIDIVAREGDIRTAKGAMISAMAFWSKHGLNGKAEAGATGAVVDSITRVVNKSTKSYPQRRSHFLVTKKVFRVLECVNLVQAAPAKKKGKKKGRKKK